MEKTRKEPMTVEQITDAVNLLTQIVQIYRQTKADPEHSDQYTIILSHLLHTADMLLHQTHIEKSTRKEEDENV